MKQFFSGILGALFGLMLLFILFVTSFEAVCYWTPGFYEKEFSKYQVTTAMEIWTGDSISMPSLLDVMHQTMVYLRGDRENLIVETEINGAPSEFYNDNEKSHMADVRVLFVRSIFFRAIFILCALAIISISIVFWDLRGMLRLIAKGCFRIFSGFLLLLFALFLFAAINFNRAFTIFHQIFFRQGNWMFDPRESRMINMLPESFFSDCALRIGLTFFGTVVLVLLLSVLLLRYTKPKPAGR